MVPKKILPFILLIFFTTVASSTLTLDLEHEISDMSDDETIEVIVSLESADAELNDFETKEEYDFINATLVELKVEELEELENEKNAERIEPDYLIETQMSDSNRIIGSNSAWFNGYKGENISVGVMDTGIDYNHSFLEVEKSRDFTGEGQGDFDGHGTHVAGTISSQHPVFRGVAPEAKLYDVKVLNGTGQGRSSDILEGLKWAIEQEVDIISMSIGSEVELCNGRDIVSIASRQAYKSGILVVAASGNLGPEESTVTSPGCAKDILTVGAVDKNDLIAHYSSRGLTDDGRVKPDIVAPGTNIISTWPGENFRSSTGTSMATPHVSGQAALLMSQKDNLSPEDARSIIKDSSNNLGFPENYQGEGRINITESMELEPVNLETSRKTILDRIFNQFERLIYRLLLGY